MKIAQTLLATSLLCTTALAQVATPAVVAKPSAAAEIEPAPTDADGPEKIIARFFSYLQRKEVDQAYDQLTRGTKIAERAEDVKTLKTKTKEAVNREEFLRIFSDSPRKSRWFTPESSTQTPPRKSESSENTGAYPLYHLTIPPSSLRSSTR